MGVFITSDLHIGHNKEFLYQKRGFNSIQEHDEYLVQKWNSTVSKDDVVYILGDILLNDIDYGVKIFNRLNGIKIIIAGNHDTDTKITTYLKMLGVIDLKYGAMLKNGKNHFLLSHFPVRVGQRKHFYNLCGHVHTTDRWLDWKDDYCYHVELDAHEMTPISLKDIAKDIGGKISGNYNN